jgi:hypothetical protein
MVNRWYVPVSHPCSRQGERSQTILRLINSHRQFLAKNFSAPATDANCFAAWENLRRTDGAWLMQVYWLIDGAPAGTLQTFQGRAYKRKISFFLLWLFPHAGAVNCAQLRRLMLRPWRVPVRRIFFAVAFIRKRLPT